jgi:hypothetical protein
MMGVSCTRKKVGESEYIDSFISKSWWNSNSWAHAYIGLIFKYVCVVVILNSRKIPNSCENEPAYKSPNFSSICLSF